MLNFKIFYVELHVANAKHTSYFYQNALGFDIIAYGDETTGLQNKISFLLQQKDIYLIITSSTKKSDLDYQLTCKYGDRVKNISFTLDGDINEFYHSLKNKNILFVSNKKEIAIGKQNIITYTVSGYGDIEHSICSVNIDLKSFLLCHGYRDSNIMKSNRDFGLLTIDHVAFCLPKNKLKNISSYYRNFFGFKESQYEYIHSSDKKSGMTTLVIESENGGVKFPLVEPLDDISPLNNFLFYYDSGGVHHIAFSTDNIIETVLKTSSKGVEYLSAPPSYYQIIGEVKNIPNLEQIQKNNILIETSNDRYLMQIFSKPTQPFSTFSFEIIERKFYEEFGSANIKALYDSVDSEKKKYGISK